MKAEDPNVKCTKHNINMIKVSSKDFYDQESAYHECSKCVEEENAKPKEPRWKKILRKTFGIRL